MVTKQNKISDYLVARCRELFPSKKQIFNPYDMESNNEEYLEDGFGVGYGAIQEGEFLTGCLMFQQDFTVQLTKKFYSLENDADRRLEFEKELMNEAVALIKNLARDVQLGGLASRVLFSGSPGIQTVFPESQQYIFISLTFNASFRENL